MYLLDDVITYVRRIIKTPSDADMSDGLIIDYINRFWLNDVDARLQLFDLKTKYQFLTVPGVDQYNMPLYTTQLETTPDQANLIFLYPVYQGFTDPCYVDGINCPLYTQKSQFFNIWPNIVQNTIVGQGDGGYSYSLQIPFLSPPAPQNPPINALLRGHIDMYGIVTAGSSQDPIISLTPTIQIPTTSIDSKIFIYSTGSKNQAITVTDSGQFLLSDQNYGFLIVPGQAPFGWLELQRYDINNNTVNYVTGQINVQFLDPIPAGNNIYVKFYYFQSGLPRGILFYNNVLTLRNVPDRQYLIELDAYLTPCAYLNDLPAIKFGYMSEYIARGAARKILSDTGDIEQLNFYEPFFREQEMLVWKRSQRQFTATRTASLYSQGFSTGFQSNNSSMGGTN